MSGRMSVVVIGGGTMGLAAALALARRGAQVTVLEQETGAHDNGSHSGYTRVLRHAYHEGSGYVPLVQEADASWCALEREFGEPLLVRTGLLEFGPTDDPEFLEAQEACRAHGVKHETVSGVEGSDRWPLAVPNDWAASFTPSGGYLRVAACFAAMRRAAEHAGAEFHDFSPVSHVEIGDQPRVRTADGRTLTPDRVVVSAGVSTPGLLDDDHTPSTQALRRVLFWLKLDAAGRERLAKLPVWAGFVPDGFFYGFPHSSEGIVGLKVACHTSTTIEGLDDPVDPQTVDRELHERDWAPVRRFLERYFPAAGVQRIAHRVCMYSTTPDWHFMVDRHPASASVVVATGFSGHGFKFAPSIGRLVADLLLDGAPPHPGFEFR